MNRVHVSEEIIGKLIGEAAKARENAYAPYSKYKVGAALLCTDGTVIRGCNVENASFGATQCAERNALTTAVTEGYRTFTALAITAGPEDAQDLSKEPYPSPCGICRQGLREFVNPADFPVIMAKSAEDYRIMTLEELLPESFGPESL